MSDNIFNDELIPAGIADEAILKFLAANRRANRVFSDPYPCTIPGCGRTTDNPPYNGICRSCSETNSTNEPSVILSRIMGWLNNTPVDLIDVLTAIVQLDGEPAPRRRSIEELIKKAQTPEGQDYLASIWDISTRFAAHTVVTKLETIEATTASGMNFGLPEFIVLPEEKKQYQTRPRPKTRTERAVETETQRLFFEADANKRRDAARVAALKTAQKAVDDAKNLGADVSGIEV